MGIVDLAQSEVIEPETFNVQRSTSNVEFSGQKPGAKEVRNFY
jgi:hypothetical protein